MTMDEKSKTYFERSGKKIDPDNVTWTVRTDESDKQTR